MCKLISKAILRTSINSHRYKFDDLQLEHAIEYATDCKHEGRKVIHQHLSTLHFRFLIYISWITHAFVCRVRTHLYRISLIIIQIVQSVLRISREDRWISFRSMADTIMNIYNPELFQKLCSTTFSFPIVATIKINLFKQKYSFTRRKSSIYMNLCDRNWKICTLRIFNIIKKYDIMFLNCNSFLLFE